MHISRAQKIRFQPSIVFDSFDSIIDALDEIDSSEIVDVAAVLSKKGKLFELNITSAVYWELIENGLSIEDLSMNISEIFDVELAEATKDVKELTGELLKLELIDVDC